MQQNGYLQNKYSLSLQNMENMDLFATRANKKINKYISWKPNADSIATDAFSVIWEKTLIIVSYLLGSFGEY